MRHIKPESRLDDRCIDYGLMDWLLCERLYEGLGMIADKEGRLGENPRVIRAEAFPFHPEVEIERLLGLLEAAKKIDRYEVKGERFIWIRKFDSEQCIFGSERYSQSKLPAPPSLALQAYSPVVAPAASTDPMMESVGASAAEAAGQGEELRIADCGLRIEKAADGQTPILQPTHSGVSPVQPRLETLPVNDELRIADCGLRNEKTELPKAIKRPGERFLFAFYGELYGADAGELFWPQPTAHELEVAEDFVAKIGEPVAIGLAAVIARRLKAQWPEAKRFAAAMPYLNAVIKTHKDQEQLRLNAEKRSIQAAQEAIRNDAWRTEWAKLPAGEREFRCERIREQYRNKGKAAETLVEALGSKIETWAMEQFAREFEASDIRAGPTREQTPAGRTREVACVP